MSSAPTPPTSRRPSPEALDRLYVLWLASSLLLLLLIVVLTLLGSGQLRRQAARLSEQSQAIDQLRTELFQTRQELSNLKPKPPPVAASLPSQPEQPTAPALPSRARPSEPPASPPTATQPGSDAIRAVLATALRDGEELPYEIADRAAAERALQEALRSSGYAAWGGETWARLAVVARLLDRDELAETFALRATGAGEFPDAYYQISARQLLAQSKIAEALVFAKRLVAGRPRDPRAVLLLAEAYRMQGDLAAADVALDGFDPDELLPVTAKLRLGQLLVALERWERLETLLGSVAEAPPAALPELNYLRAVSAIQRGNPPEALAILDNLLVDYPEDYNLRTWRGVALLEARQFQAAREALAHAEQHPERPEALYWRGVLEERSGNTEEAIAFFQRALAASYGFAPAWEALGAIALNRGDLPTTLQNLTNAVNANPRHAVAHFLLAITYARMSQPDEAANALRMAFRLDPSLLQAARQTEVITQVLSEDVLEAIAADVGVDVSEPNEPQP